MFGFRRHTKVEKVLKALEGYTRSFGKAPATVFSVPDIEQLLEKTADVDTTAAMLTIGHAAAFSEQFVDRTDYKATVRAVTEAALRQGTGARAAIETRANDDHYETAKAFANGFVRLLDEGRIVGTAKVRAFIAEHATSHLAAWTLYRLRLQSAYEDSLAPTDATQKDGRNDCAAPENGSEKIRVKPMQHLELRHPLALDTWRNTLLGADSGTSFHTHDSALKAAHGFGITPEFKRIIDDFGEQARAGIYAVRKRMIEAVWIDPFHNYMAVVFTKAGGDPEDVVLTLSLCPDEPKHQAGVATGL